MKVTKKYLKQLIEEELKSINELGTDEDIPPAEEAAPEQDPAMMQEPAMGAEEMLLKLHTDLTSWMQESGLSPSQPDQPVDVAE
jgi:hypothetical protein